MSRRILIVSLFCAAVAALPAPLGPTASTVTMSSASITPAAMPGASESATVLALQPGAAILVAPRNASRCLVTLPSSPRSSNSGTPYCQGS